MPNPNVSNDNNLNEINNNSLENPVPAADNAHIPNSPDAWKLFLATLMNKGENFTVEVDEQHQQVKIQPQDAEAAKNLEEFLNKPWIAKNAMAIQINKIQGEGNAAIANPAGLDEDLPPPPATPDNEEEGKAFLKRLFKMRSDEVMLNIEQGIPLVEQGIDKRILLWELKGNDEDINTINNLRINYLRNLLKKASRNDLYRAGHEAFDFTLLSPSEAEKKNVIDVASLDAKPIEQSIDITVDKNGKKYLYISYQQLASAIYPPQIIIDRAEANENGLSSFTIDMGKFLTYMGQNLNAPFIVHPLENSESGRPIAFQAPRNAIHGALDKLYLIIDESQSMWGNLTKVKEKLRELLGALAEKNSQTEVTVLFFSSDLKPLNTFTINETKTIADVLNGYSPGGQTALDDALASILNLDSIKQSQRNQAIILLSDGEENQSKNPLRMSIIKEWQEKSKTSHNPVKLYTFGIGDGYNENYFTNLAKITGCEHQHLNNINDMKLTAEKMAGISRARVLMEFIQAVDEAQKNSFKLNVPEGSVVASPADQSLQLDGVVQLANGAYQLLPLAVANHEVQLENTEIQPENQEALVGYAAKLADSFKKLLSSQPVSVAPAASARQAERNAAPQEVDPNKKNACVLQ